MASWPQMGVPIGVLLSAGLFTLFNNLTGNDFGTWGWRIPFLLSSVLIFIGLYIRGRVLETPIFAKLLEEKKTARAPVLEVLKNNPREVILSALLRTGQQAPFYIFITFVLTYGSATLGLDQGFMLNTTLVAAAISCFTVPFWGHVSDIVGRKRLYLIGAAVLAVYAFPYFSLLDTRSHGLVLLAVALSLPLHDIQYGPQAALIAESFPSNLRYSGASLGYQLASITSGGPAPLIATFLLENFKSGYAIATYMFACGIVTVIATAMLKDRSREDIAAAETYERRPAPA
jgi:MFS family permease